MGRAFGVSNNKGVENRVEDLTTISWIDGNHQVLVGLRIFRVGKKKNTHYIKSNDIYEGKWKGNIYA